MLCATCQMLNEVFSDLRILASEITPTFSHYCDVPQALKDLAKTSTTFRNPD
jgi:hypothetical protein